MSTKNPNPEEAPLTSTPPVDFEHLFDEMSELLGLAVNSLQLQNARSADHASRHANALFDQVGEHLSEGDFFLLKILKYGVSLFAPITRAQVFQIEGRYEKALKETAKGIETSEGAIETIEAYIQTPDRDEEIIQVWQPLFSIFPILFKATDASIRADVLGYQGKTQPYIQQLKQAVHEFRQVDFLPQSTDPTFLALAGLCTSIADRLETRAEVFSAHPIADHMTPSGDKIFIIHGHDEAKWRELRDLLEDRLKLETVVLKESPNAGKPLIQKFEEMANECCFAFALVTPDDVVEKEGISYFQARPNVLFELGWFYGRFGRDRVCIIKKAGTELPSNLDGMLSVVFHERVGEGIIEIEDELRRAGVL